MTTIHGIRGFLEEVRSGLNDQKKVQIAGGSDPFCQLATTSLFRDGFEGKQFRRVVVVVERNRDLTQWTNYLSQVLPLFSEGHATHSQHSLLASFHGWGRDRFINPALAKKQRLYALSHARSPQHPHVFVTTLSGLAQKSLSLDHFRQACLSIEVEQTFDQDDFIQALEDIGYIATHSIEEEGTYAVRGGIVDVFPLNLLQPLRVEFIGDQIGSMRLYSLETQTSEHDIAQTAIVPAIEAQLSTAARSEDAQTLYNALLKMDLVQYDREGLVSAFKQTGRFTGFDMFTPLFRPSSAATVSYFAEQTLFCYPGGFEPCFEAFKSQYAEFSEAHEADVRAQRPSLSPTQHFCSPEEIKERLVSQPTVEFRNPYSDPSAHFVRMPARLVVEGAPMPGGVNASLFDKWTDLFKTILKREEGTIAVLATQSEQLTRIKNLLSHRGFSPRIEEYLYSKIISGGLESGGVFVGAGDLTSHLWIEESNLLIIPEAHLFGASRRKAKPASVKLQNYLSSFEDLKVGDLVVHLTHGIGRYQGMTKLDVGDHEADYLLIGYAAGDKIYLPVDRLSLLQRYSAGSEGERQPAVDKLRSASWEKRKSRVKKAVRDMADELLKIHAKRKVAKSHVYSEPGELFFNFESEFPYEETEDQLRAIQEVNADLTSNHPMDRLVCGDVGFGKTEVALRASFRVVADGYQVVVLVPTTVLCYQHYRTFSQRMEKHGVHVAQVNRFVKGPELSAAVSGFEQGHVDVLVGTHRLLSKDIKPKRLGLIIVDEEQRFGVGHKEKLKQLRSGADLLTLTATPIPRTLHMSMLGLRDISIITTPPQDRLSVKTYVSKFDEQLVKEAIEYEIARSGQIFFIHNRVQDIEEVCTLLKKLVPGAGIRFAHGQMPEQSLEKVIIDFLDQKFSILVCTTIVENGIDMPNVNTLIVNRADRFGLSQLYQLRGRVGRSTTQAFAYFLTPPEERVSEDGARRLEILSAHQELGAGFQIASHDLELRGAGNLLGADQSGHVSDVGLEMYTDLLDAAIRDIRGQPSEERVEPEIKLPVSAIIPADFMTSENQRLHYYKKIFSTENLDELGQLRAEIRDRFGPLPAALDRLLKVSALKQHLRQCQAISLVAKGSEGCEVKFGSLREEQIDNIMKVTRRRPEVYQLSPDYRIRLAIQSSPKPSEDEQDQLLEELAQVIDPLSLVNQEAE